MTPTEKTIQNLHDAYVLAVGIELNLNPAFSRQWYDASKMGLQAEDIAPLIRHLQKRIKAGVRQPECLKIKNLVGSDEAIADSLNEIAAIKALQRKKVFPQGKQDVLRATGRETEPQTKPRHISEVFKALSSLDETDKSDFGPAKPHPRGGIYKKS